MQLDRRANFDDRIAVGLALHRAAAVLEADDEQLLVSVGLTSLGDLLDRLDPDPYWRGDQAKVARVDYANDVSARPSGQNA